MLSSSLHWGKTRRKLHSITQTLTLSHPNEQFALSGCADWNLLTLFLSHFLMFECEEQNYENLISNEIKNKTISDIGNK